MNHGQPPWQGKVRALCPEDSRQKHRSGSVPTGTRFPSTGIWSTSIEKIYIRKQNEIGLISWYGSGDPCFNGNRNGRLIATFRIKNYLSIRIKHLLETMGIDEMIGCKKAVTRTLPTYCTVAEHCWSNGFWKFLMDLEVAVIKAFIPDLFMS